jgi:hypothetical protein
MSKIQIMKILFGTLLAVPGFVLAQKNCFLLSAEFVVPNTNFQPVAAAGWGAAFRYEHKINRYFTGIATAELASFGKKTLTLTPPPYSAVGVWRESTKTTMIPFQVGTKFHLTNSNQGRNSLFLTGEFGLSLLTAKASLNSSSVPINSENRFSLRNWGGMQRKKIRV